jgi:hypothetical protein
MNNKLQESSGVIKHGKLGIPASMDLLRVILAHHRDTYQPTTKSFVLQKLRFEYQDVYWNSRLQEEPLDVGGFTPVDPAKAFSLPLVAKNNGWMFKSINQTISFIGCFRNNSRCFINGWHRDLLQALAITQGIQKPHILFMFLLEKLTLCIKLQCNT